MHYVLLRNLTDCPESIAIDDSSAAPIFFRISSWLDYVLSIGLMVTWTFGLLGKYAIFLSIYQMGLRQTPINLLILTDQTVNLVHRSLTILGSALVLYTNQPLAHYFGYTFCLPFTFVPVFGTCYTVFGSFATTFYRGVVIRRALNLERVSVRQLWPLAITILVGSLTVTFVTSGLFYRAQRKSFVTDLCYGYSENYLSILMDYSKDDRILPEVIQFILNLHIR